MAMLRREFICDARNSLVFQRLRPANPNEGGTKSPRVCQLLEGETSTVLVVIVDSHRGARRIKSAVWRNIQNQRMAVSCGQCEHEIRGEPQRKRHRGL